MPFNKTEVDIHTDYQVQAVETGWLSQGVKSPKHLMLDPEPCILCRACEDVCPWNCIYMLDPGIVQESETDAQKAEVDQTFAVFIVDDNACTRCSVCVERCPSDCLYYARLPDERAAAGPRSMGAVPMSQQQAEA